LSRPFPSRSSSSSSYVRVNGKIRAREVRVVSEAGQQLGVMALHEAITLARNNSMDLVEVAPNATPPVCRIVDYGKFRYEQSKKDKESRKHQHANKVKEIQLRPGIDPHDFGTKLVHAVNFLCEDMKVKISLRFRGREMAHKEFGFQVVSNFIKEITPYGHPDAEPKLVGRGINVMISPLPRNKRAPNPRQEERDAELAREAKGEGESRETNDRADEEDDDDSSGEQEETPKEFTNNPFASIEDQPASES